MTNDPTFVFLHGAGTGPWVWDRVISEVSTPSVALDVNGRTADATPEKCARQIVSVLDAQAVGDVVVVMHSLAGALATGLSRGLGSRLRRLVFVSAVIPPPGGAFVDTLSFGRSLILKILFKVYSGGLKPSAAMIRHELCNDLSEEDAELVVSRYEAEMPGLYLTPVEGPPLPVGCVYVKLLQDRSVPPERQDHMIAGLRSPVVHELDAGHLAMLSRPSDLANILIGEKVRLETS